jgi:hypothetical protein
MTTFLNWKQQEPRSKERLITDLFSYLSPRWYPVNAIGTNIYYLFEMYAEQLSSASLESQQVFEDLFIDLVRTTAAPGYSYSKMYDNFGRLFEVDKLYDQNYEIFSTSSVLQSFRQQLRFLSEAFFNNTTFESIERIGQSYTGISPLIRESSKETLGWRLETVTGSILSIGDSFLILDTPIPEIGTIYKTGSVSGINVGDDFFYTYSELNNTTIILGSKEYYGEVDCYIFASGSGSSSFQNSVENSINNVLKADIIPFYNYSDVFSYWRPSTSSITSTLQPYITLSSGGYLYNTQPIFSTNEIYCEDVYEINTPFYKYSIVSNVVELPASYSIYQWYYDWSILTRNDTTYTVYLRSYSSSSIPNTVYFKEYRSEFDQGLLLSQITPSGSLKGIGHWVFTSPERANDISGNLYDLVQVSGSITTEFILSRNQTKLGWKLKSGSINLSASISDTSLNLYDTNFLWESWIYGVDNTFNGFWAFKRENSTGSVVTGSLINEGYAFIIDNNFFSFSVKSGSITETVSGSISNYLLEEPYRPHYFSCLYIDNIIYLYIDNQNIRMGNITTPLPNISTGSVCLQSDSLCVGIDEIYLSTGSISPDDIKLRFQKSSPKVYSQYIFDPDKYHQIEVQVFGEGKKEFELHQFSLRGIDPTVIYSPVFLSSSSLTGF